MKKTVVKLKKNPYLYFFFLNMNIMSSLNDKLINNLLTLYSLYQTNHEKLEIYLLLVYDIDILFI